MSHMTNCRDRMSSPAPHPSTEPPQYAHLSFALDKPLHQPLWFVREVRSGEHADAQIDRFGQWQFLPLTEQGFLRAQGFGTACQKRGNGLLDRAIKTAFGGDHVDQPP